MATAGPTFPTTAAGNTGDNNNILADDGLTLRLRDPNIYFNANTFGFAIPLDATIDGIEVTYDITNWPGGADIDAFVDKSVNERGGTSKMLGDLGVGAFTIGGPSDLWGRTWTPAEINAAGFGVTFLNNIFVGTNRFDYVTVTIHFTPAASGTQGMKVGADNVNAVKVGATNVTRVYVGSTLVFE